jgi:hypothetical protein
VLRKEIAKFRSVSIRPKYWNFQFFLQIGLRPKFSMASGKKSGALRIPVILNGRSGVPGSSDLMFAFHPELTRRGTRQHRRATPLVARFQFVQANQGARTHD